MPSTRAAGASLVAVTALLTLAACGSDSSSGPKPLTAPQLAAHYDSLALALENGPTLADTLFSADVALFNGVIADGQLPSTVQVTIGGATQTWNANFVNWVDSAGTDSLQVVSLWSGTQALYFAGLELEDVHPFSQGVIAQTGDYLSDSALTFVGTFTQASGACSFTSITDVANFIGLSSYGAAGYVCSPATATIAETLTSHHGDTTASAALQTVSLAQQTINGVRLQLTGTIAQHTVRALRARAAAHGGMGWRNR